MADYSERKMSVPSDKLPALAGVAQLFGSSENYLIGLWRQDLLENLLWKPAKGQYGCTKPAEWRAPSCSWMSLDGAVKLDDPNLIYKRNKRVKLVEATVVPMHKLVFLDMGQ